MANYGLRVVNAGDGAYEELPVANSATVTAGDPVYAVNNSGQNAVRLAAAAEPIYGIAEESLTGNGVTKIKVLKLRPNSIIAMENDNDTNSFGDAGYGLGNYFNLIGNTGAVLIDTSTGTDAPSGAIEGTPNTFRQFLCVKQNPDSANAKLGLFKVNHAMLQA